MTNPSFQNGVSDWTLSNSDVKHDPQNYGSLNDSVRFRKKTGGEISQIVIPDIADDQQITQVDISFKALGCNNPLEGGGWCTVTATDDNMDYVKWDITLDDQIISFTQQSDYNEGVKTFSLSSELEVPVQIPDLSQINVNIFGLDSGHYYGSLNSWHGIIIDQLNFQLTTEDIPIVETPVVDNTIIDFGNIADSSTSLEILSNPVETMVANIDVGMTDMDLEIEMPEVEIDLSDINTEEIEIEEVSDVDDSIEDTEIEEVELEEIAEPEVEVTNTSTTTTEVAPTTPAKVETAKVQVKKTEVKKAVKKTEVKKVKQQVKEKVKAKAAAKKSRAKKQKAKLKAKTAKAKQEIKAKTSKTLSAPTVVPEITAVDIVMLETIAMPESQVELSDAVLLEDTVQTEDINYGKFMATTQNVNWHRSISHSSHRFGASLIWQIGRKGIERRKPDVKSKFTRYHRTP